MKYTFINFFFELLRVDFKSVKENTNFMYRKLNFEYPKLETTKPILS